MQAEEALACLLVGHIDVDNLIDASCAQHCSVDALGMVGGCQHINALLGGVVELAQKLVGFAVLVAAFVAGALRHQGIELVEKDQRRRLLFSFLEQFADLLLRTMHEGRCQVVGNHLDEVDAQLLGNLLGKERLAASGRTIEQYAGRRDAIGLGTLTIVEHVDESLGHQSLQLLHTSHIIKSTGFLGRGLLSHLAGGDTFWFGFLLFLSYKVIEQVFELFLKCQFWGRAVVPFLFGVLLLHTFSFLFKGVSIYLCKMRTNVNNSYHQKPEIRCKTTPFFRYEQTFFEKNETNFSKTCFWAKLIQTKRRAKCYIPAF